MEPVSPAALKLPKEWRRFLGEDLLVHGTIVAELCLIRWQMHDVLGRNAASLGVMGLDIYLPIFVVSLVLFFKTQQENPVPVRFRWKGLQWNAAFLGTGVLALRSTMTAPTMSFSVQLRLAAFILFTFATVLSAAFIWLRPKDIVDKLRALGPRLAYALFALLGFLNYTRAVDVIWRRFAWLTGRTSLVMLKLVGFNVIGYNIKKEFVLQNPLFSARLDRNCIGSEALAFFLFTYFFIAQFEPRITRRDGSLRICLIGCSLMFATNAFRIAIFFAFAVLVAKSGTGADAKKLFVDLFHMNVGWLLYFAVVYGYLAYLYRRNVDIPSAATTQKAA